MDKEKLAEYGIDLEKGLKNCLENQSFYKKILSMFLQDECFAKAKDAYAVADYQELFCRMHELKGISGNAALMSLYEATIPLVELLRNGYESDGTGEVDRFFEATEDAYYRACDGIARILAEE